MRVLVTGGAGFIGSHLVDRLLKEDHEVHILDNFSTGSFGNLPNYKNLHGFDLNDITSKDIYDKYHDLKFDVVFHLAAQINLRNSIEDPIKDAKTNIIGTVNLLKVLKTTQSKDCKFIFASTGGAIYNPSAEIPWTEKSSTEPVSPYGIAKLTGEKYIKHYFDNYIIFRLSNVYGPRQNPHGEAGVVSIFLDKMLRDEGIKIFGDGDQTRDFVYVKDVVDAFMLGMKSNKSGIYNVSSNIKTDVNTIAGLLIRLSKKHHCKVEMCSPIKGELKNSCLSYDKIKKDLGWEPKTNLYDGLLKTVNHYT